MHFITTCVPECCSSLVCRRQLQSCIYDPLWAEATSNGLYYYPPHSSGGNIQPTLGCLGPKACSTGKRRPGLFILLFSHLFSLQLQWIFAFLCRHLAANTNRPFLLSLFPSTQIFRDNHPALSRCQVSCCPHPNLWSRCFCIPFSPPPGDQKSISMRRKTMKERGLENHKRREESEGKYCSLQGKKTVRQLF